MDGQPALLEEVADAVAARRWQFELLAGRAEKYVWGLGCRLVDGQRALWEGRAGAGGDAAGAGGHARVAAGVAGARQGQAS